MCQNEASIVQTLSAQNGFNKHENEHEGGTYFYMNGFTRRIVLNSEEGWAPEVAHLFSLEQ